MHYDDENCPACGDPVDYCPGHGEMNDPAGYRKLVEAGWIEEE